MSAQDKVLHEFMDKHHNLSSWYLTILCNYCRRYMAKYEEPVGRPIATFMLWFNKKHGNMERMYFSNEEINWYYIY